jgi:hypothetical protein
MVARSPGQAPPEYLRLQQQVVNQSRFVCLVGIFPIYPHRVHQFITDESDYESSPMSPKGPQRADARS